MIERMHPTVSTVRSAIAALVALRWLRIGGLDLAIPLAAFLTVAGFRHQLRNSIDLAFGLPFAVVWLGLALLGVALVAAVRSTQPIRWSGRSGALRPAAALSSGSILAVFVVSGWLAYDMWMWQSANRLYDLEVYLGSAARWMAGGQPYLAAPLSSWPVDPARDYLLYPPPFLPIFGLLSQLPDPLVGAGWTAFLVACAYTAFRALGLPNGWSLALLAFPPVANGFESGNIASLPFLLFALGYRAGAFLPLNGMFKVQLGLPALWLIRTGRWRAFLAGVALVAAVVVLTLPLVGLDSWHSWLAGLQFRAQSQAAVPALYGFSYARVLSPALFGVAAVAAVVLALLFTGRRGLAAFGLATIMASPALWPHGFTFALPAVLMFENGAVVLAILGAGAAGADMWLLFYAGWLAVFVAPRIPDAIHPMAGTEGPWPLAAAVGPETRRTAPSGARRLAGGVEQ